MQNRGIEIGIFYINTNSEPICSKVVSFYIVCYLLYIIGYKPSFYILRLGLDGPFGSSLGLMIKRNDWS